ncbi:MAG: cobalt-precorrin-5B (C(1))-methyltransferase CbiD [Cyanobacteriota bacterium]|nr:cobalt-precorrin-5B (C(1))-methyltransferase CbiD [Cyanobacteriota bacterium]
MARSGYTLPVFACAAALGAVETLKTGEAPDNVEVDLVNPPQRVSIPIEQGAVLDSERRSALAITRSDPGDNLDLTRQTPVWAKAEWLPGAGELQILGGEGIGRRLGDGNAPAIYRYAQTLLETNLAPWLRPDQDLRVDIILPEGRRLATRTSNAAFGVIEGLSLLGTSGISEPLSAPEQLETFIADLQTKAQGQKTLIFCLGENGLDLARRWGAKPEHCVKVANWLGPMLAAAAQSDLNSLLLLGYHGKLLKLAGGIFHTHHSLADARLEILTSQGVKQGLPLACLQTLLHCATAEAALQYLRQWDLENASQWTDKIYQGLAETLDQRAGDYVQRQTGRTLTVGSLLFDGARQCAALSENGRRLAESLGMTVQKNQIAINGT